MISSSHLIACKSTQSPCRRRRSSDQRTRPRTLIWISLATKRVVRIWLIWLSMMIHLTLTGSRRSCDVEWSHLVRTFAGFSRDYKLTVPAGERRTMYHKVPTRHQHRYKRGSAMRLTSARTSRWTTLKASLCLLGVAMPFVIPLLPLQLRRLHPFAKRRLIRCS
jgi:hypothetical protein